MAVCGSQWQSVTVNSSKWQSMAVSGSLDFIQVITNINLSAAGAKADRALPMNLSAAGAKANCALPTILSYPSLESLAFLEIIRSLEFYDTL